MTKLPLLRIPLFLLCLGLIGGAVPSWAVDRVVPRDYATIGGAVAAAVPGDTVVVYAGEYSPAEGETFPITLADGVAIRGQGKMSTILDATGQGVSVFQLSGATLTRDIVISSLQIRGGGGLSVDGGAVSLTNNSGAAVVLRDCFIRNCTGVRGGAIWASDSVVQIDDTEIRGCLGNLMGGGIAVSDAAGSVTITNSILAENTAARGNGGGVAVLLGAQLALVGATIDSNTAKYGGGLFIEGSLTAAANALGDPTAIRRNSARVGIGGLQAVAGSALILEQTLIEYNDAPQAGAFRISGSTVSMDRCSIAYNTSTDSVADLMQSSLEITNTRVHRNQSAASSILWLEGSWGDLAHATIASNVAPSSNLTGAVAINGAPNPPQPILRIVNTIIADNEGMGVVEETLTSDPYFHHNLVSGNTRGYYTDEVFFVYTGAAQFQTLLNNAPQSTGGLRTGVTGFSRPGIDDYRLLATSDGFDRASVLITPAASSHDYEGKSRLAANAGAGPDMGAHESIAPHLLGPVLVYGQNNIDILNPDDLLMFQFDRPIRLTAPLVPGDFYLPVAGDYLPPTLVGKVDPRNPTHLLVTMAGPYSLRIAGQFSMGALVADSPSGIDLRAGIGTLKVVDAELGTPSLPTGSDPTTNSAALDIGQVAGPATTGSFSPIVGGLLYVSPTSYLPTTHLGIGLGSLFYPVTLRMEAVRFPRASFSAVKITIITGSPVLRSDRPAILTMQYDPAECRAWGYQEDDLTVFRLTEVDWDEYEFQDISQLYGHGISQNLNEHTLTLAIDEIVPPRPLFPASAETNEGALSAIYVVLPRTVQAGTTTMEPIPPIPVPVRASVYLENPEDLALSGGVFPTYIQSSTPGALEIRVRSADSAHEITGALPRPFRRSLSAQLAFDAKQLGVGSGTPLSTLAGPGHIMLQLSDGIHSTLPMDFWSFDGIPVSGPQMRGYCYSPATQTWDLYPSYNTIYDGATRVLSMIGVSPVIPGFGVGLYTAGGDPDAPIDINFASSPEGWESGDASPQLPAVMATHDSGVLKLTADGPQGYGWWGAPAGEFFPRRDRLFLMEYEVVSNAPAAAMPGFNMRVNSGDNQRTDSFAVFGSSTETAAPGPSLPKIYPVFVEPSAHSVEAAHEGNAALATLVPYFEMLHFAPGKNPTALVGLKSFHLRSIDKSDLGPWSRRYTYDFAGTGSLLGWTRFGAPLAIPYYTLSSSASGLRFGGGLLDQFAGVGGVPLTFFLQPNQLYRIRYRVHTDTEPAKVPSFRLRVGDAGFESMATVIVSSAGEGQESPSFKFREYDVYYYPPQALASLGTVRMGIYFDYMNFTPDDKSNAVFTLESVVVDEASWAP